MGGRHTDGTVMVGQYTQTRQSELRAKIVKSSHDRYYVLDVNRVREEQWELQLRSRNLKRKTEK